MNEWPWEPRLLPERLAVGARRARRRRAAEGLGRGSLGMGMTPTHNRFATLQCPIRGWGSPGEAAQFADLPPLRGRARAGRGRVRRGAGRRRSTRRRRRGEESSEAAGGPPGIDRTRARDPPNRMHGPGRRRHPGPTRPRNRASTMRPELPP
eukprot:gene13653-biopygen8241